MALNNADKQLIDELATNLRARYREEIRWDAVTEEEMNGQNFTVASNHASAPVAITKEDLRNNSGRQLVRNAYLAEVAAALNQKMGVSARADTDKGVIYAQAIPDGENLPQPMSLAQLNAEAERAKERSKERNSDE